MGNMRREVFPIIVVSPAKREWEPVHKISRHQPIDPQHLPNVNFT